MRYFWHAIISITFLAGIIFLFFVFSVRVKNNVAYTDQKVVTEPEITIADPSVGPADAAVTIVNYGDYECAACAKLDNDLKELKTAYGDDLRIVWKDLPNTSQHKEALTAAMAARCGGEQKKFWEFHELLMLNQKMIGADLYTQIVSELKLKARPFERCLETQDTLAQVQRTYEEGLALQISATPTIFINGERYTGEMTTSEIRRKIDSLIDLM